eukprot:NODE_21_length_42443_cov_0.822808.p3 type:complete len:803 gc:universal NODE_21_length_42443_cov_0.822808:36599-39007(+)
MSKVQAGINGLATAALNLQNSLWIRKVRNIEDYLNLPGQVSTLESELLGMEILECLGLAVLIIFTAAAICTCLCRVGCNKCGGRKGKPEGYSNLSSMILSILITILALVFGIFGAFLVVFCDEVGLGFYKFGPSILNTISEAQAFSQGISGNASNIPSIVVAGLSNLKHEVRSKNWTAILNENLLDSVTLRTNMIANNMDSALDHFKQDLNASNNIFSKLSNELTQLENDMDLIKLSISTFSSAFIDSVTYNLTGAPSTASFLILLPDFSEFPNLTILENQFSTIPSFSKTVYNSTKSIKFAGEILSSGISDTLDIMIPKNIAEHLNFNVQNILPEGITSGLKLKVASISGIIDNGNNIRNDTIRIFYALSVIPWLFALFGIVLRKRSFLRPLTIFTVIFGTLFWLSYSLIFVTSLPINDVCRSFNQNALLDLDYHILNTTFNPAIILNGCRNGLSILEMEVGKNHERLKKFGNLDFSEILSGNVNFIYQYMGMNKSLLLDSFNGIPNINLSKAVDFVIPDVANLSSLSNYTPISLDFSNITNQLNEFSQSLNLTSIDPKWNETAFLGRINKLNNDIIAQNNSWNTVSYDSIWQNYVFGKSIFNVAELVPNIAARTGIQIQWDVLIIESRFKFLATAKILQIKQNCTDVHYKLNHIQNQTVPEIDRNLGFLQSNLSNIKNSTDMLKASADQFKQVANALPTNLTQLELKIKSIFIDEIEHNLKILLLNLSQLMKQMTICKPLASAIDEVVNSDICQSLAVGLNGMWLCSFILGLCCVLGFVFGIKGEKRIGNFYKPIKVKPV